MSPRTSKTNSIFQSQAFWVFVILLITILLMSWFVPSFATPRNFSATARNLSFIALMAVGMSTLIIGGGIDLSVGSVMGLSAIVTAVSMNHGYTAVEGVALGLLAAYSCGFVNGFLIAKYKLSPFVVTLGMMSLARSLALVISNNKTLFEFGPDEETFFSWGAISILGMPLPLVSLFVITLICFVSLKYTRWGRAVYAIGGNELAAKRAGVNVLYVKVSLYVASSLCAGLAGILMMCWLGSVSSSLGTGYELNVIAASVIGGAQLTGGVGGVGGALIGATLVETIRNSLLLVGVNPYWQGAFVAVFIIGAVLLDAIRKNRVG